MASDLVGVEVLPTQEVRSGAALHSGPFLHLGDDLSNDEVHKPKRRFQIELHDK